VTTENKGYLHQPKASELRWLGDTFAYFLATGDQTGGAFALVDEQAKRGETVPLHRHREDMESFYVLDGEIMLYIGDQPGERAGAGSFAHVPGGTVHGFRVESETARYLLFTTPRHGDFYRAITVASGPGGAQPLESVDGSQIKKACAEYGIEYVGPLPTMAEPSSSSP
jgi:quercetin dioxygenase-like cupin family protein